MVPRKLFPGPFSAVGLSFILFFIFPAERLQYIYIFSLAPPTCTTTIITLKPCALNAKFSTFHTGNFDENFITFVDTLKKGIEGGPKTR